MPSFIAIYRGEARMVIRVEHYPSYHAVGWRLIGQPCG